MTTTTTYPIRTMRGAAATTLFLFFMCTAQAFLLPVNVPKSSTLLLSATSTTTSSSTSTTSKKAVLNQRMPWDLSVVVKSPVEGLPDITTDLKIRFVEEPGYEPPQGKLFVERDPLALIATDDKGFALVGSPAWTLSEDKDDHSVGEDGTVKKEMRPLFGGQGIPGKRLYFRFAHSREDGASVLMDAKVWYKEVEMQKADPLGIGGTVNVGETKEAGEAQLRPVFM